MKGGKFRGSHIKKNDTQPNNRLACWNAKKSRGRGRGGTLDFK